MKRLLLAMLLVPSLALAKEHTAAARGETSAAPSDDPMAGWVPPKVKNAAKDKQEIQALLRSMEAAGKTGDLEAAVALVDFPVMMITDSATGQAMGEPWTREQWTAVMKPFYDKPMKDMKVTHKPDIFLLSDSLASVDDSWTMTQGGKTLAGRNTIFVIRRDGEWRVKAMAEGGWGDVMAAKPPDTAAIPGSASESMGSAGAAGSATEPSPPPSGTGAQEPPASAPGSAGSTAPSPSPATPPATPPTGTQEPTERTTK